jgi:IMP dehydrogenase/GMP reductase
VIYLIFKMFVYLILAGGIGGPAGWLLRNLQAQQSEEKARRVVTDAKSKVPQLESLLRGRDEQVPNSKKKSAKGAWKIRRLQKK